MRPRTALATLVLLGVTAAAAGGCSGGGGDTAARPSGRPSHRPAGTGTTSTTSPRKGARVGASPDDLPAPGGPGAAARALTRVETGLRGDDRRPEVLRTLGWEQQLAYRALSAHPDWVPAVEAAVPAGLRGVVDANVSAGAGLGGITAPQASLPDWTILTPQPAGVLRADYAEAQQATGIPWAYLAAIHFVETRMGRIHGNSSAGAQGPMQFLPSTWAAYGRGGNIDDDHDAILAAGRFLAASGGPGDMDRALFAYNRSRAYVAAVEAYARVMLDDPRAYDGYYQWQVYYATTSGVVRLPEGYGVTR